MRLHLLIAASGVLVSGCASTPYFRPTGPVAVTPGSVDAFAALVPSSAGVPHCEEPTGAHLQRGERAVAWVYPPPTEQQVTVVLDATGVPTRYIDVRGDLSTPDQSVADRTTIGLYLDQDYAVLSNRPSSGSPVILEVPLSQALSSERLGNPSATMERVLTACAGGD